MRDDGTSTDYQRRFLEQEQRKIISDNNDRIRQALARAYCTDRNRHKVLDSELIEDMVNELNKLRSQYGK